MDETLNHQWSRKSSLKQQKYKVCGQKDSTGSCTGWTQILFQDPGWSPGYQQEWSLSLEPIVIHFGMPLPIKVERKYKFWNCVSGTFNMKLWSGLFIFQCALVPFFGDSPCLVQISYCNSNLAPLQHATMFSISLMTVDPMPSAKVSCWLESQES